MSSCYRWHSVLPERGITAVRFGSVGGKFLITSRCTAIFGFNVGEKRRPVMYKAPNFNVTIGIFNEDCNYVIAGSLEGKIGIWPTHGLQAKKITVGHSSGINDIVYSPVTDQLITASNDQTIKIWTKQLEFLATIKMHKSQVTTLAVNSVNTIIVSGDSLGTIAVWDLSKPREDAMWRKSLRLGKRSSIISLSFDFTGTFVAAATSDGHISIWDVFKGELIQAYEEMVTAVAFSPTQPFLLASCNDCVQKIYSLQSSSLLFSFEAHKAPGAGCAWDPSGHGFVSADRDGIIIAWDIPKTKYSPIWYENQKQIEIDVEDKKVNKKTKKKQNSALSKRVPLSVQSVQNAQKLKESSPKKEEENVNQNKAKTPIKKTTTKTPKKENVSKAQKNEIKQNQNADENEKAILILQKLLPTIDTLTNSMAELSKRCSQQEERLNELLKKTEENH